MPSQEDLAFGQVAVEKKFCTAAQVAECLELQTKERELGVLPKSLAELLMEAGHLSQYLVREVYKFQGKQEGFPEIAGYVVDAKIGHGGMGTVYRAIQQSLDRVVAIKVLASNLSRDREFVSRFMREARSVASLNHENIIVGIDVGQSNGHHFFAMEYVDGPTVHDILRMDGPLDEPRALAIVRQIALALAHANEHDLVHRDVKPGNIMVIADGTAKLCDLGLAKSIHQDNSLTHTGTTHGTPHYMSPEQARGSHDIDIRSDIYSLGATLYQMVVGEVPFTGASAAVVLLKHLSESVPSPRHRRPNLSDGVCHLIEKMMAKRVEHRYQTPRALLADLDRVLAGDAPLSARLDVGQSSVMPASAPPAASTSITDTPSDVMADVGTPGLGRAKHLAPLMYAGVALVASVVTGAVIMGLGGPGAGTGPRTASPPSIVSTTPPGTTASGTTSTPSTHPPVAPSAVPDPAHAALEAQAGEWLAELQNNIARHPDDHREHLAACEALTERFPGTLAAQKTRGLRSDIKARWFAVAAAALAAVTAGEDELLRAGRLGEAKARLHDVAREFEGTPAGADADHRHDELKDLRTVLELADVRRAAAEAESEGDYTTAIAQWKRALLFGEDAITAEAKLQIERLEGLRRFAEAAADERAAQVARSHLHNFVFTMRTVTLLKRDYREALAQLREFAATPEVAPLASRLDRETALIHAAAETYESAQQALSERIGTDVALRRRGVTDRLISGRLRSADGGVLKIALDTTARAVLTLPMTELALEDLLRLAGASSDTAAGRFAEGALRYGDDDLAAASAAFAAAAEAGMPLDLHRRDLDEHRAWLLLQEARRAWIAEHYRDAGEALERLQRRHRTTQLVLDHADEVEGRAALAPIYEERAAAVRLMRDGGAAKVFGSVASIHVTPATAGPPHLGIGMEQRALGAVSPPHWFLLVSDIESKPWGGDRSGLSGAPSTGMLFEPQLSHEAPVQVAVGFLAAKAPAGTLFSLAAPFAGEGKHHAPVRIVVADGGAVVLVEEHPHGAKPSTLLRIDGLKLGDHVGHTIAVTLGEGRVSVSVDGLPPRSAAAGPRRDGHVVLDGHGPDLRYQSVSISGRLVPRWVLSDSKVRRLHSGSGR